MHWYRNVSSAVPQAKSREVVAMLKAIHAQEDRAAAEKKAADVVTKLEEMKLAKAAKIVEEGVAETLSYMAFPREHWTRIRTNNPLERIMREIRRRTRVVGAFPDGHSALMLVAARLRYVAGTRWGTRKYLDMTRLGEHERDKNVRKSRATKWRVYSNPIIELTDAAARDLGRVSRAAPLPDKGKAQHQCAQLDGHYLLDQPGHGPRHSLATRLSRRPGHVPQHRDGTTCRLGVARRRLGRKRGDVHQLGTSLRHGPQSRSRTGQALADFHIFKLIAEYWGCGEMFRAWESPETVFQLLKRLSVGQPCDISGIEDYKMLDERGGVQWPFPADCHDPDQERRLFADGKFYHPDGRARFICESPRPLPEQPNPKFPFLLLTGRGSAAQWHTQTRTAKSAILRKLYAEELFVEISSHDAARLHIRSGDSVRVWSQRGRLPGRAVVTPGRSSGPSVHPHALRQYEPADKLDLRSVLASTGLQVVCSERRVVLIKMPGSAPGRRVTT